MRKKKAVINLAFSLILEIITVLSGFIVPKMFIEHFGSDVNGLVNSISSFIGYITLLQTGVGSVVKSSLYKPLANGDNETISSVVRTSEKFFGKIGMITVVYVLFLAILFPTVIAPTYGFAYTASLVCIVSLSTLAQYFFGISYQMLVEADQRGYIYSVFQILTIVVNTVFVIIMIRKNYSIQVVKLATASFYVARPILMGLYVRKKYKIDTKAKIDNNLISQRWDSFTHGIATFIHTKTDVFVLTIFSTLTNVSIYSVYAMVTAGLNSVITAVDKSVRGAFGNIIARNENENLISSFNAYNCLIHMLCTVCFSTANATVFRFIDVYTKGVSDAVYRQPLFGVLIITAEYIYCMRSPYYSIIFTAGKFKETKISACIEALLNILVSCILVRKAGLIGVAIGTLIAMIYRTGSFIWYLSNNVLYLDVHYQIKRYCVSIVTYVACSFLSSKIQMVVYNYGQWVVYASLVFIVNTLLCFSANYIFMKNDVQTAMRKAFARRKRK